MEGASSTFCVGLFNGCFGAILKSYATHVTFSIFVTLTLYEHISVTNDK